MNPKDLTAAEAISSTVKCAVCDMIQFQPARFLWFVHVPYQYVMIAPVGVERQMLRHRPVHASAAARREQA